MKWTYLPEYPKVDSVVLIAIKGADFPWEGYWNGYGWMSLDNYNDEMLEDDCEVYAWCELPQMPDLL